MDSITTIASANLIRAVKLGCSLRVIPNWGKRNNPGIDQSVDVCFL